MTNAEANTTETATVAEITADEAHALRELLWQRIPVEMVFGWLAEKPVSWAEYQRMRDAMAEYRR